MSGDVMNIYCWIHSTYSINDKFNGTQGVDYPHPGLGEDDVRSERLGWTHHKYYQWVVFVLVFQAGCFYLPRLLWKTAEGGVMKLLTAGLTDIDSFMKQDNRKEGVQLIASYYNVTYVKYQTTFTIIAMITLFQTLQAWNLLHEICFLRISQLCQRCRSNLLHGHVRFG